MPGVDEWDLLWRLALALGLSAAIGLERELSLKSAGLRTYTLVGVGAALFMLVSKYGFFDVLQGNRVVLDPSRVAAQIVSGIGFIGAGLIFVRREAVRGLTTAAGIWLTAAVGAAAGADLPVLAAATTAGYFVVAYGFHALARRLPRSVHAPSAIRLVYLDGRGVLRRALQQCTERGFTVAGVTVERQEEGDVDRPGRVAVLLEVYGGGSIPELGAELEEIDGVLRVSAGDVNAAADD